MILEINFDRIKELANEQIKKEKEQEKIERLRAKRNKVCTRCGKNPQSEWNTWCHECLLAYRKKEQEIEEEMLRLMEYSVYIDELNKQK